MKVLIWQEASLESRKGFCKSSRFAYTILRARNLRKSIQIRKNQRNPLKSMRIHEMYEMQWKSSEDKNPIWDRAKVAAGAANRVLTGVHENPWKSFKIYNWLGNQWKSIKSYEIRLKTLEDKKPAWDRAEISIAAAGLAYKHAKFESRLTRAAIASAKRFNISLSKYRGLETSAAETVGSLWISETRLLRRSAKNSWD